ncbi:hypothetical protein GALMADRAFT_148777 [Galerina marginata CBS 339.88]|uniref:Uncharacterized protein n=1 Tax=Galerina marginata (strain CBS 339.88) TaxID=685588 RepID=A0A067S626_GALM3|nr:hypothetical protein GALMADRAFT_148777 [Galerina marginata CBS 339.88]
MPIAHNQTPYAHNLSAPISFIEFSKYMTNKLNFYTILQQLGPDHPCNLLYFRNLMYSIEYQEKFIQEQCQHAQNLFEAWKDLLSDRNNKKLTPHLDLAIPLLILIIITVVLTLSDHLVTPSLLKTTISSKPTWIDSCQELRKYNSSLVVNAPNSDTSKPNVRIINALAETFTATKKPAQTTSIFQNRKHIESGIFDIERG